MRLYQEIARALQACQNCVESDNTGWIEHYLEILEKYNDLLPSGAGFDCGCKLVVSASRPDRLVISADYHHMDDGGYYDGWSEHTVVVTPSLAFGFNLRVTGRDRNEIKDYIAETFDYVLRHEVEEKCLQFLN